MRSNQVKRLLLLVIVVALLVLSMSAVALAAAANVPIDSEGNGANGQSGDGIPDGSDLASPFGDGPAEPNDDPPMPGR